MNTGIRRLAIALALGAAATAGCSGGGSSHHATGGTTGSASTTGTTSGTTTDPRVTGGTYNWNINQEFFTIMPVIMWRITTLSKLRVPFVGAGPRIYMYPSAVYGQAGASNPISNTTEVSSQVGFGVPFGLEVKVGPGGFLAEFLAQWGLLEHTATGDSHAAAIGLSLGYRLAI